ncbi:MAG: hypothetical protein AAGJ29_04035, partial [Pseudomonadota bacterium]
MSGGLAFLFLLALTAVSSAGLCWCLMVVAPQDAPDGGRKDQAAPVPTSGGLAIAGAMTVSLVAVGLLGGFPGANAAALLPITLLSFGVLALGAIDDAAAVPTRIKLGLLSAASLLAAATGVVVDEVFLPLADSTLTLPPLLAIAGTAFWIFLMMNAVNFMDGANGIAIGSAATLTIPLALYLSWTHDVDILASAAGYLFVAASLGFLFWNLRGRLYAGDAGALFSGALFAALSVLVAEDGNIWFPATLCLPFLIDVIMTLAWRASHGRNLLQPHRDHAYQLFRRTGSGHLKVAAIWWGLSLICAGWALWAATLSKTASASVFAACLAIGIG